MFELDADALAYGVTAIENKFLLEYMPAAKGDYVKVYLWGLFKAAHPSPDDSLAEMAQELFLPQAEIEAALRYWERRALVSKLQENPPVYRFYSPLQRQSDTGAPLQVDQDYVAFAESVYAAFADRRKVTPSEIALAWEWVQDVGLRPEVVLMLLMHCAQERGPQFSFKKAEPLAVRMKEEQVSSCEDADAFLRHEQGVHEGARKVLSRMGKRRAPSEDELALYEKWIGEWGFAPDAVLDACRETTKGDPSFKYLDGILSGIRGRSQARTGAQVSAQLEKEQTLAARAQEVFSLLGGRPSGPAATRLYQEFTQMYPHEVLLLAAQECHRTGRNVEDLQSLLQSWQRKGLKTEAEVQDYLSRFREANLALREIFDACGHRGKPTAADRLLYEKWRGFGMDLELLLFAAEQARSAEGSKIGYLDKVLEIWHEAGINDISQARAQRRPQGQTGGKTVSAQRYGQRDYTEEELTAVSGDLIEEARKNRG